MMGYDIITLDYDDVNQSRFFRRLDLFARVFERVEYRRSASGRGFHVRLTDRRRHSFKGILDIRRVLGDDPARVILDRARHPAGILDSVLFTQKGDKVAGPWVVYKS